MDIYGTKQIRNVVLLGHGGAGKTTVAEALAYLTGVTKRMGKVADGNTISDYDKEEIKRQFLDLHYNGSDRVTREQKERSRSTFLIPRVTSISLVKWKRLSAPLTQRSLL